MDCITGQGSAVSPIRCDWLDVTFPSGSPLWDDVADLLLDLGAPGRRITDSVLEYRLPGAEWGNIQLSDSTRGWSRLSASGGSCEALRGVGAFDRYLGLVGCTPHTVTRLDACLDLPVNAPPIIQRLVDRYPPDSFVFLTRKGVSPGYNLQPTRDGGITGTFYAGNIRGKQRVFARVYDKQAERASRGVQTLPWVRYELVFRKGIGVTLRDAQNPGALFWKYASPALIDAPPGIPDWEPFTGDTWAPGAVPVDSYQRLRRCVENSVDVERFIALADDLAGDGRRELLRLIRNRLGLRNVAIA